MANSQPSAARWSPFVIAAIVLTSITTLAMTYVLISPGGLDLFNHELPLSGASDPWEVAPFVPAPVLLADDLWMSVPARSADGTVFGLVRSRDGNALLKLDEASGRVLWRVPAGPGFADFTRNDGWHARERAPAVPLTLVGDGVYLIAWQRAWALVAATNGALVHAGAFPGAVPPVAPEGGLCLLDDGYWLAIEDGRDGGIMLSTTGVLADVRSERPARCLPSDASIDAASPLQNAHATPIPFPTDLCAETRRGKIIRENAYCHDKRSDGPPEHAVLLKHGDPVFRDGDDWRAIAMPIRMSFSVFFVGYELAWPRAFFNMVSPRKYSVTNAPAPTSFEAKHVSNIDMIVETVASIARDGRVLWHRSVVKEPYVQTTLGQQEYRAGVAQYRSLLLASHPDSPVKNLYIFKPGLLLAVDQDTGATRFQVGAALKFSDLPVASQAQPEP